MASKPWTALTPGWRSPSWGRKQVKLAFLFLPHRTGPQDTGKWVVCVFHSEEKKNSLTGETHALPSFSLLHDQRHLSILLSVRSESLAMMVYGGGKMTGRLAEASAQ